MAAVAVFVQRGAGRAVAFDGGAGGPLFETDVDGQKYVWGTVQVREPGKALSFSWHPGKPEDAALGVSVTFEEAGAMTRVRLVHSGWERLGDAAGKAREAYASGWPTVFGRLYKANCEQVAGNSSP